MSWTSPSQAAVRAEAVGLVGWPGTADAPETEEQSRGFQADFETILDHFGTILGQFWDHFGTILESFSDYFGGPFWDYFPWAPSKVAGSRSRAL